MVTQISADQTLAAEMPPALTTKADHNDTRYGSDDAVPLRSPMGQVAPVGSAP
jgi:hypothetical protein